MAIDMSISSLKNKISTSGGLQRNNRFYVEIYNNTINATVFKSDNYDPDNMPKGYYAETVLLPDISMTTQADGLAGPGLGRTSPRGLFYKEGLIITFPVLGDWNVVKDLEKWLRAMYYQSNDNPNVWITQYYSTIAANGQLKIYALDLNGDTKATYTFYEAYPIEIVPLQFSHFATNEYLKVQARFLFREYKLE